MRFVLARNKIRLKIFWDPIENKNKIIELEVRLNAKCNNLVKKCLGRILQEWIELACNAPGNSEFG